jgi:heme/copper-type cytochrome/quinol oxidase subunit 3
MASATSPLATSPASSESEASPGSRLPGGLVVWIFMHPGMGVFNTGVLLVASWAAARAVLAHRREQPADVARWWVVNAALGVAFVVFALWAVWHTRAGTLGTEHGETVEAGATYWHFVDLIWLLLFPTLYLAGGAS